MEVIKRLEPRRDVSSSASTPGRDGPPEGQVVEGDLFGNPKVSVAVVETAVRPCVRTN